MLVWYGYEKTFKSFSPKITPILVKRYPNGSNAYYLKDDYQSALLDNPKSHIPISLSFSSDEIKRLFPDKSAYQISPILQDKINTFLLGTFSIGDLIYDFIYSNESNLHQYNAIYIGGDPVTVSESVLFKIKSIIGISEAEEEKWLASIPDQTFQKEQIDPYPILDEAYILTLSVPFEVSELELEFIAKCAFISNAFINRWLCPYANRISWKVNEESGTINVPIWNIDDAKGYEELLDLEYFEDDEQNILTLARPRDRFSIQLSDGNWYYIPESIAADPDFEIPVLSETFVFEGKKYNVTEVENELVTEDNWKIKNISRVAPQIAQGLLPFVKPYPVVKLTDAEDRLTFTKDEAGIVVSLNPDKYILGVYSGDTSMDQIQQRYTSIWNDGGFLTNGGHVNYKDSMSPISFSNVRKLNILL